MVVHFFNSKHFFFFFLAEGTRDTAVGFAKASACAVTDIIETTVEGANAVIDGTKSGAKYIVDQTGKAMDIVEEKGRLALIAAIEASSAGAEYAGYRPGIGGAQLKPQLEYSKPNNN